eukprot:6917624-Pyramimonas_sp.AAC.1
MAGVSAYSLLCARPPSPTKKQHNMHLAAKSGPCAAIPRSLSQVVFDRDGGGRVAWPAVRRPTSHNDGHGFSTRMAGADMFPDVCCHVRRRT